MPIFRTARYQVKADSVERAQQANRLFVEFVKANEPKTHVYAALQQGDDPTKFMNYMIFEDEAAEERHRSSDGVKRFTDALYPLLVADVAFTGYSILAST